MRNPIWALLAVGAVMPAYAATVAQYTWTYTGKRLVPITGGIEGVKRLVITATGPAPKLGQCTTLSLVSATDGLHSMASLKEAGWSYSGLSTRPTVCRIGGKYYLTTYIEMTYPIDNGEFVWVVATNYDTEAGIFDYAFKGADIQTGYPNYTDETASWGITGAKPLN